MNKVERYEFLRDLSGLPNVRTQYVYGVQEYHKIEQKMRELARDNPLVWIRTDVPNQHCPLFHADTETIDDNVRYILEGIGKLPNNSSVLIMTGVPGTYIGNVCVSEPVPGDLDFLRIEFAPANRYRELSEGRATPRWDFTKGYGHEFRAVKNTDSRKKSIIPVLKSTGIDIIREWNYYGLDRKALELSEMFHDKYKMGKQPVIELGFWYSRAGLEFVDFDVHGV